MMKKRISTIAIGFCLVIIPVLFVMTPVLAADKVIELTVNDHNPAPSNIAKAFDSWGQWVEEKSNGKLKMTIIHGGALLKGNETFRGVQGGIADLGHYVIDRRDGMELNTVTALPFLGMPKQRQSGELYWELLGKFPEMMKEYEGLKVLAIVMMPPSHIHTTKKQVKTPADMKGLKIFTPEFAVSESVAAMGGTPVHVDITDMYMSLDRGLVEGVMLHYPVCFIFRALELMPYHTVFGDGGINMTPMELVMNQKRFDKLPSDLQKVILESGKVWEDKQLEGDAVIQNVAVQFCKDENHTFTYLTPEQIDDWRKLVKEPVHDRWIKDTEAKGLPAKAVYTELLSLIKKYSN
ncbi:TRAP transporter substrate-binding protein DctP [Thermodesulfobacteriota bacterium]